MSGSGSQNACSVEDSRALLRLALPPQVELGEQLERPGPLVEGDVTQLQQVLTNLAHNAGEALGSGPGAVEIRTGTLQLETGALGEAPFGQELEGRRCAFVEFADTGPGIKAEALEKIFEPFFTTKTFGRGLGLAVVFGAVRGHGGAVLVHSAPGQGTRFRIFLPLCAPATETRPKPEQPARGSGRGTILIVDDEPIPRKATAMLLRRLGFEVECACDGRAGLEAIEAMPRLGAVILDMSMPGMDGAATLARLRQTRPDLPVLLTSGHPVEDVAADLLRPGRTGFVRKPFDRDELGGGLLDLLGAGGFEVEGRP